MLDKETKRAALEKKKKPEQKKTQPGRSRKAPGNKGPCGENMRKRSMAGDSEEKVLARAAAAAAKARASAKRSLKSDRSGRKERGIEEATRSGWHRREVERCWRHLNGATIEGDDALWIDDGEGGEMLATNFDRLALALEELSKLRCENEVFDFSCLSIQSPQRIFAAGRGAFEKAFSGPGKPLVAKYRLDLVADTYEGPLKASAELCDLLKNVHTLMLESEFYTRAEEYTRGKCIYGLLANLHAEVGGQPSKQQRDALSEETQADAEGIRKLMALEAEGAAFGETTLEIFYGMKVCYSVQLSALSFGAGSELRDALLDFRNNYHAQGKLAKGVKDKDGKNLGRKAVQGLVKNWRNHKVPPPIWGHGYRISTMCRIGKRSRPMVAQRDLRRK